MAHGKLVRLSPMKSFFIEFIFKPLIVWAAAAIYPFLMWASPIKSYRLDLLVETGDKTAKKMWGNGAQALKMKMFCKIFASFLEADNAYMVYFAEFLKNYSKTLEKNGL